MNQNDTQILAKLIERVVAGTLAAADAVKAAYSLGVSREILDHAKRKELT